MQSGPNAVPTGPDHRISALGHPVGALQHFDKFARELRNPSAEGRLLGLRADVDAACLSRSYERACCSAGLVIRVAAAA